MLRVLQVTYYMNRRGLETLLINIHRNIDRSKVQFDYLIHENQHQDYEQEILQLGGKLYSVNTTGKHYFKYKRLLDDFYAKHPEHKIVHGHFEEYAAFYLEEAKKYNKITIAHSHNTRPPLKAIRLHMFHLLDFRVRSVADYFFACSRQAGIYRYGKNKDVKFLPNGIETDKYQFSQDIRKSIRESRYVQNNSTLILGHVGQFRFQKNHKYLIEIFRKVHEKIPDSKLWLIGIGPIMDEIRTQVHSLGLDDAVDFIGSVSNVNKYLMGMDVFVFPSFHEGLSVALIEAQCSGLPCVVSYANQDDGIVSDRVSRLALSETPEVWAEEVLRASRENTDREAYSGVVSQAGFDIRHTAQRLQEFYLKQV